METTPAATGLRLALLGEPRLFVPDAPHHVLDKRDAALLAILALDGPRARKQVAALLWPEADAVKSGNNLRQRLFRLKRIAGREVVVGDRVIALTPDVEHDLTEQKQLASMATLLGGIDYGDTEALDEWVQTARTAWRSLCLRRLADVAARCEAEGRLAEALVAARQLTAEDPSSEHAHRQVMRLHHLRGDRGAALQAFEQCRVALDKTLGMPPGDETRRLASMIQSGDGQVLAVRAAVPLPVSIRRPPLLIGRSDALASLDHAWRRGRTIVLIGEAGIGKTRLTLDFVSLRAETLKVSARPGDASVPYSVLSKLLHSAVDQFPLPASPWIISELARLLPALGASAIGPLQPVRLRQAILQLIDHCIEQGVAGIVVDDLHFSDDASLDWLVAAAPEINERSLPVILASRPVESVLLRLRSANADPEAQIEELRVEPLTSGDLRHLLTSLSLDEFDVDEWTDVLHRHTGGNVMFVLETIAEMVSARMTDQASAGGALSLPIPRQVSALIQARLSNLPSEVLRLAQVAALAGQDFTPHLAAQILGVRLLDLSDAWNVLDQLNVFRDGRFAHDLLLEATVRSVPDLIRRAMHADLAREIQRQAAPAARVAEHWWQACAWSEAMSWSEKAAAEAAAVSRPAEQLHHLGRAATAADRLDRKDCGFRLRTDAIEPALLVEAADLALRRADDLVCEAATDPQRLLAQLAKAKVLLTAGRFEEGLVPAQAADDLASRLQDRGAATTAKRLQSVALAVEGRIAEGLGLLESVAGTIDEQADEHLRRDFWSDYGYVLSLADRRRDAVTAMRKSIELSTRFGDLADAMINYGNLSGQMAFLGHPEQGLEAARRSGALRTQIEDATGLSAVATQMNVGMLCAATGRCGEALDTLQDAIARFRAFGEAASTWVATAHNHLAGVWVVLGQFARARQVVASLPDSAPLMTRVRRVIVLTRAEQVSADVARVRLAEALDSLPSHFERAQRLPLALAVASTMLETEAIDQCSAIREEALAAEHVAIALSALIRKAEAARRCGRHAEAGLWASEALEVAVDVVPFDIYRGEFWWLAHQCLTAAGRSIEARHALQQGMHWIDSVLLHVPDPFRDSFLNRNPSNRQLRAASSRLV